MKPTFSQGMSIEILKLSSGAEPGISGLEKTAPSGELEFSSRSN